MHVTRRMGREGLPPGRCGHERPGGDAVGARLDHLGHSAAAHQTAGLGRAGVAGAALQPGALAGADRRARRCGTAPRRPPLRASARYASRSRTKREPRWEAMRSGPDGFRPCSHHGCAQLAGAPSRRRGRFGRPPEMRLAVSCEGGARPRGSRRVIRCSSAVLNATRALVPHNAQVAPPAGFEPATRGLEGLQH